MEERGLQNLAEAFDAPKDSPDHLGLRDQAGLGGRHIECRYYLGMLIGRNEFRQPSEEFLDDLTEFVVSRTSTQAAMFCCTEEHCQFVVAFLRRLFEIQEGLAPDRKETKEHRAIEVLLRHADWSDEQIAAEVGATAKSVKRCWSTFQYARRCQRLYEQRVEGWYIPRPARDARNESSAEPPPANGTPLR
jgi:hypothetical protein